ncbi:hypothetical protein Ciccas_008239 [Cichlidogyrus casuarinus]|uniref:Uncharacterized protein n=1 Tax=Cichlidogyrus casuarinus TaxID=1844966 RepID=A0ABD2Q0I3_9PLAT
MKLKTNVATKEEIARQEKVEEISNLADITYENLYGQERFQIGEKILPSTGVFSTSRKRNVESNEQFQCKQEENLKSLLQEQKIQFFAKSEPTLEKKDTASSCGPKVVFKKRNISNAARNSRTTRFND